METHGRSVGLGDFDGERSRIDSELLAAGQVGCIGQRAGAILGKIDAATLGNQRVLTEGIKLNGFDGCGILYLRDGCRIKALRREMVGDQNPDKEHESETNDEGQLVLTSHYVPFWLNKAEIRCGNACHPMAARHRVHRQGKRKFISARRRFQKQIQRRATWRSEPVDWRATQRRLPPPAFG